MSRCYRRLFSVFVLLCNTTYSLSSLLYNGPRLSTLTVPDFRMSFVLRSNNGSDSFREVYTGQNQRPFHVRVYAKVLSGVNAGFCFEGVGAAQVCARKTAHSYGGFIYAYNSNYVRIWAPSTFRKTRANGRLVSVGQGWGGEIYRQRAEEAVVFVEVWNIGPVPTFQAKVVVDTRLPERVFFEVEHKLAQLPERVTVRVTPRSSSVDPRKRSPNQGFWFNAISSSQNVEKKGYGGVIFGYNETHIQLWAPSSQTKKTGCVFVQDGWGDEQNVEISQECLVYIFAWIFEFPVPSHTTDWKTLSSQDGSNSFWEIRHKMNILPSLVVVQGRVAGRSLVFEGTGAIMSTDQNTKSTKGYGGIVYAYDKNAVRIWLPQRTNGTSNGYSIFVSDSWGDGKEVESSNDVKVRVIIYTSNCAPSQETVTQKGICKAFKYNSYLWQTGPWLKCSSICNAGTKERHITGCQVSTFSTVDEVSCGFTKGLCMWQATPPSSWRRIKGQELSAEDNFMWNSPKDPYYVFATSNSSKHPVFFACPKFPARKFCSLSFKYKMFGKPPPILSVEVSVDGGTREPSGWSMEGNQGGVIWRTGFVKLMRFTRITQVFFKFALDRKREGDRYVSYGNVSLDDLKLECEAEEKKTVDAGVCKKRRIPSAGCVIPASQPTTKGPAFGLMDGINNQKYVIARGAILAFIASYDFMVHVAGEYSIWLHALGTSAKDNSVKFKLDNLDQYFWHTTYLDKVSRPLWTQYVYETFSLAPGIHTVYFHVYETNFKFSHLALTPKVLLAWSPLGMQSGYIPDSSLRAYPQSSFPAPKYGRLNGQEAWCSSDLNPGYVRMQITLPELALISRIAVQGGHKIGRKTNGYWVTKFAMKVSMDGIHFSWYRVSLGKKLFDANLDARGIVEHVLPFAVLAKKIQIFPYEWKNWICMRVELYGVYMTNSLCAVAGPEIPTQKTCVGDRNCSTNAECKRLSTNSVLKTGLPDNPDGHEVCHCYPGYHGDSCEHVGCSPNPCHNGGKCSPHSFNFTCSCPIGYYGPLCQHPCPVGKYGKDCTHTCVCGDHGTCHVATGHCSCEPGYFGVTCDQVCPRGYFGDGCIQRCGCRNNGDCDHINGTCSCTGGWSGRFCDHSCSNYSWGPHCRNQCNCSENTLSCDPESGECVCKPGMTGKRCDRPCPFGKYGPRCTGTCRCGKHGICDQTYGNCSCDVPGWTGIKCDQPCPKGLSGDNCAKQCNCSKNAECNSTTGKCKCGRGFSGSRCHLPCSGHTWGPGCKHVCQCSNNATCDSFTGACQCPPGWHGTFCDNKCADGKWGNLCQKSCECKNNASCDSVTGVCQCRSGWSGLKCEKPCSRGLFGPQCKIKCLCVYGNSCEPITGECHCPPGWQGRTCAEACPSGRYGDACLRPCSCRNGASCDHISGLCTCSVGWTGLECSQPCPMGFFGTGCSEKCQCSQANTKYCDHVNGRCHCKPGYIGKRCSQACDSRYFGSDCSQRCQCQNGGECRPTDGACICLAGYYGQQCESKCPPMWYGINCTERCSACIDSQALACNPVTGKCLCSAGYYGYHCENRCPEGAYGLLCKLKCDCKNAAHCNHVNGSCECAPGFTGSKCERPCPEGRFGDKCRGVCLCNNGGSCDKVSGQCTCLPGYYGTQCINECPERRWGMECRNKCSCAWNYTVKCRGDTGACQCRAGYRGATCEKFCEDGTYGQDCKHPCPKCSRHVTGMCYKVDGRCPCSPGYRGQLCDNDCLLKNFGKDCGKRCRCSRHQVCHHVDGTCHDRNSGQFVIMILENYVDMEDMQRQKQIKLHLADLITTRYDKYREILRQLSRRQINAQTPVGTQNTTTGVTSDYTTSTTRKQTPASSSGRDIVTRILKWSKGKTWDKQEVVIFNLVMFNHKELLNGTAVKNVIELIDENDLSEKIGSVYYSGSLYSETPAKPSVYIQLITGIAGGLLLLVIVAILVAMYRRRRRHLKSLKSQKKKEKDAETEMEMKTRGFRHNGYRLAFDNPYYDVLAAMALDDDIEEDYINPLCDLESLMSHQGSDGTVSSATECSIQKGESLQSVSYC